jgi:hypothetical protein
MTNSNIYKKSAFIIFFLICFVWLFYKPANVSAQASCSLDQVYQTCGAGNFACISVTPTPVAQNPWIKVKTSSFAANSENTFYNFNIPSISANRSQFNAADPDENGDNSGNFMIGDTVIQPGVLTAPDVGNISTNVSSSGYKINKYTKKKTLDPRKFLDYALARKDTIYLNTMTDVPVPNKINIYKSPGGTGTYVIDGKNVDNFRTGITSGLTGPTVVIIDGNLNIQRNINFKTQTGYTANLIGYTPTPLTLLVTGTTTVTSVSPNEVNQINAILMSNNVTINAMAIPDNYGLKIKGNLVVAGTFTNNRVRSDSRQPVMFIVLDPVMYTSLLPYFSTAQYEWKQIQ